MARVTASMKDQNVTLREHDGDLDERELTDPRNGYGLVGPHQPELDACLEVRGLP